MTVEIPNIEALNKVLKALRKVDSVYEVRRKNDTKEDKSEYRISRRNKLLHCPR